MSSVKVLHAPLVEIKIVKWKVSVGRSVDVGSVLLTYQAVGSDSKKTLKAQERGKVCALLCKEGDTVAARQPLLSLQSKFCSHSIVMKDMCAECGADLRELDQDKSAEGSVAVIAPSVSMVPSVPELKVTEQHAQEIGQIDEKRLMKARMLNLVVDLDQTIIHTTVNRVPAKLKDVHHFRMAEDPGAVWYHTKFRPGTLKFLEELAPLYELSIATYGVRAYAHLIARMIDAKGALFSHRILSREEFHSSRSKTANLRSLFPCGDGMVCIIDDREEVWNYAPNLIPVKPYHFFKGTGDINAPPGSNDAAPKNGKSSSSSSSRPEANEASSKSADAESGEAVGTKTSDDKQKSEKREIAVAHSKLGRKAGNDRAVDSVDSSKGGMDTKESPIDAAAAGEKILDSRINDEQSPNEDVKKDSSETATPDSVTPREILQDDKGTPEATADKTDTSMAAEEHGKDPDSEQSKDAEEVRPTTDSDLKADIIPMETEDSVTESSTASASESSVSPCTAAPSGKSREMEGDGEKADNGEGGQSDNQQSHDQSSAAQGSDIQGSDVQGSDVQGSKGENAQGDAAETDGKVSGPVKEEEVEWEDNDDYLERLTVILKRIHSSFFELVDSGKPANLKELIPALKHEALVGCTLAFSGLFPSHIPLKHSYAYHMATKLGAKVEPHLTDETTHVVAAKMDTEKAKQARKRASIPVVHPDWLWACWHRWQKVDEEEFTLTRENQLADPVEARMWQQVSSSSMKRRAEKEEGSGSQPKHVKEGSADNSLPEVSEDDQMGAAFSGDEVKSAEEAKMRRFSDSCNTFLGALDMDGDALRSMGEEIDMEDSDDDDDENDSDDKDKNTEGSDTDANNDDGDADNATSSHSSVSSDDKNAKLKKEAKRDGDEECGTGDDEGAGLRFENELRKKVLSSNEDTDSSSDDSLSADYPKGWRPKQKKEERSREEELFGLNSSSDSEDESGDSLGDVDEAMAEALDEELQHYME